MTNPELILKLVEMLLDSEREKASMTANKQNSQSGG